MTSVSTDSGSARDHQGRTAAAQVSLPRLYALRAGYLLIGAGLAVTHWPSFLQHSQQWQVMEGVVNCMLAALSLLAFLGIRYPLQMLPLLLFECAFKLIWFGVVALPLWAADQMDRATEDVAFANSFVVIIIAVIPWHYVREHYGTKRGEPWR
ncbi:hypothetical protein [Blastococcus deserti]|uniref:DoxX family protein n=1 Tax=Blastococcus deserti TaxID=2259033 RepID=A0ABW4XE27_9ACTN